MSMKKKLALVNCYFGKLPSFFELWLRSCQFNPWIDFYLLTDCDGITGTIPANVHIIETRFRNLVDMISSLYTFNISVTSPYKLTDFKPAYGHIFGDILEAYDYWGYCDVDLVFGNLSDFLWPVMSKGYQKIYQLGHLSIYRNTQDMRMLYTKEGGEYGYREVFSHPEFYSFDEHCGQMLIAKRQHVFEYSAEEMADISCRIHRMTLSRQKNYKHQVFYWEDGKVFRSYIDGDKTLVDEFCYIHMQKRNYNNGLRLPKNGFYILEDRFVEKDPGPPDRDEILALSGYVSSIEDYKELGIHRLVKIARLIQSSSREKQIWLRQQKAMRILDE